MLSITQNIKKIVFSLIGETGFLRLVSGLFFLLYKTQLLRFSKNYTHHYFAKSLIQKGDTVLDIGANLGYYSFIFSDAVGKTGKVVSFEPVPLYFSILKKNLGNRKNLIVHNIALGNEEKMVRMGVPKNAQHRHGMTTIINDENSAAIQEKFSVQLVDANQFLAQFERVDYLKCDIEGYEVELIPLIAQHLKRWKATLQIEIDQKNRPLLLPILEENGFQTYHLQNGKLQKLQQLNEATFGDLFFIPLQKVVR